MILIHVPMYKRLTNMPDKSLKIKTEFSFYESAYIIDLLLLKYSENKQIRYYVRILLNLV